MNKRVLLLTVCLTLAVITPAFAADGPYFTIMAGATLLDDATWSRTGNPDTEFEYVTGYDIGGALGYQYWMFRLEGELSYQKNKLDEFIINGVNFSTGGEIASLRVMANLYIDIENKTAWTPYIGAGAGWATTEIEELFISGFITSDEDDDGFAYQFIGGVGYEITQALTANLEYRYFATEDPDFGAVEAEYESNNIIVGLRYLF